MKALVCELCGSNQIVKTEGFFTCQSCGTKYDLEEARKLMGVTTVKVDRYSEVDNRLKNAINEFNAGNTEVAYQLFIEILNIDPDNWKAIAYKAISDGWSSGIKSNKMISTASEIVRALEIYRSEVDSDSEFASSCEFIIEETARLANALFELYAEYNNKLKGITNSYQKVSNGANISAADHAVSGIVSGLLTGNFLLAGQSVIGAAQISNAGNMSDEINSNENDRVNTYNNGCHYTCEAINMIASSIIDNLKSPDELSEDFYERLINYLKVYDGFRTTKTDVEKSNQINAQLNSFKSKAERKRKKEEQEKYEIEHADEIAAAKENEYNSILGAIDKIVTEYDCGIVISRLEKMSGYKDCSTLLIRLKDKEKDIKYNNAINAMNKAASEFDFKSAKAKFEALYGYKDAEELGRECAKKEEELKKEEKYKEALSCLNSNSVDLIQDAIRKFESISGYKDSNQKIIEARERIEQLRKSKRKENTIKILIIVSVICLICISIVAILIHSKKTEINSKLLALQNVDQANKTCLDAREEIINKKYDEALNKLESVEGLLKGDEQAYCYFLKAVAYNNFEKYEEAQKSIIKAKEVSTSFEVSSFCDDVLYIISLNFDEAKYRKVDIEELESKEGLIFFNNSNEFSDRLDIVSHQMELFNGLVGNWETEDGGYFHIISISEGGVVKKRRGWGGSESYSSLYNYKNKFYISDRNYFEESGSKVWIDNYTGIDDNDFDIYVLYFADGEPLVYHYDRIK